MIYVNGASWSQQTSTVDTPDIWPSLVAKKLNQELKNEAIGCAGNKRILDCLENLYLSGAEPDYIILGLTPEPRECLPAAEMGRWNISGGYARLEITGNNDPEFAKWWITNCYDPLESVYQYYKTLWKIHQTCGKFECPYLMLQFWDSGFVEYNILSGEENLDKFLDLYYANRNSHFRLVYRQAFLSLAEESKMWNYIESTVKLTRKELDSEWHPNHAGHLMMADFVLENIQKV
jgi:hypothetical protein